MNAIRRTAVLTGVISAVVIGSSIPAAATFSATTAAQPATVATLSVAAPAGLVLEDSCVTTTTTVTRTVTDHPRHGQTVDYTSSTTKSASTSNVQDTETTTTTRGHDTITTTVTRNTDLHVTLSWAASPSRGVSGYAVSAHLGVDGSVSQLLTTDSSTTTVTRVQDADALAYQPSLLVTTRTTYGWTATSAPTRVLSC